MHSLFCFPGVCAQIGNKIPHRLLWALLLHTLLLHFPFCRKNLMSLGSVTLFVFFMNFRSRKKDLTWSYGPYAKTIYTIFLIKVSTYVSRMLLSKNFVLSSLTCYFKWQITRISRKNSFPKFANVLKKIYKCISSSKPTRLFKNSPPWIGFSRVLLMAERCI